MGDGNIHFNISQPVGADKAAFLARWREVNDIVHAIVAKYEGSISAEHGIGVLKRDLLPGVKDPVALDVMRLLKRTLDPNGILNPGKVVMQCVSCRPTKARAAHARASTILRPV